MLDLDKVIQDATKLTNDMLKIFGDEIADRETVAAMLTDTHSQLLKAIIREHEMRSLEEEHPAIKDLREKLNIMTTLLRKQDEN